MPNATQLARHAQLVDHMANALGVDLDEQMLRGNLRQSQIEDAVLSCTNCTRPGACESRLASAQDAASKAPGYCRNAALFDALRDS